jgi:ferric-chelate reductase
MAHSSFAGGQKNLQNYFDYVIVDIQVAATISAVAIAIAIGLGLVLNYAHNYLLVNAVWNGTLRRPNSDARHWRITVAYWKLKAVMVLPFTATLYIKWFKPKSHDNLAIRIFKRYTNPEKYMSTYTSQQLLVVIVYFLINMVIFFVPVDTKDRDWNRSAKSCKLGALALGNMTYLFVAVVRNNFSRYSITPSFERNIFLHKWIGRFILLFVILHAVCAPSKLSVAELSTTPSYYMSSSRVTIGIAALVVLIIVAIISLAIVRRGVYEIFYWIHLSLGILFMVFTCIHVGNKSWKYVIPGFIIFGYDLIVRVFFAYVKRRNATITKIDTVELQVCRLHIKVPGGFQYKGGQFIFVNIPKISPLTWHPFSIVSVEGGGSDEIQLLIKGTGENFSFTNSLSSKAVGFQAPLTVHIDGPYGGPTIDFDLYAVNVFFAGGIGITPMWSILLEQVTLAVQSDRPQQKHIFLFWSLRSLNGLADLDPGLLSLCERICQHNNVRVSVVLHTTTSKHVAHEIEDGGDIELNVGGVPVSDKRLKFSQYGAMITLRDSRPQPVSILSEIKRNYGGDIAVGVCGPKHLTKDVRNACATLSDSRGLLYVHDETFQF